MINESKILIYMHIDVFLHSSERLSNAGATLISRGLICKLAYFILIIVIISVSFFILVSGQRSLLS